MIKMPRGKKLLRGRFGQTLHDNKQLVVMVFTASGRLKSESEFFANGYTHVTSCGECLETLRDNIKFY